MTDLTDTIIPKSDQINADDLIGRFLTIKITGVSRCKEPEQPIAIAFEGDGGKPYKPGKSMRRVLVNVWGPDGAAYVGRSLTLYRDDEVLFGGVKVGGIRISNMSHITKNVTMALTASRASRKPFQVAPLEVAAKPPAVDARALGLGAEDAARKGVAAYQNFWKGLTKPQQTALLPAHEGLKATARAVDAAAAMPTASDQDDPPEMEGESEYANAEVESM